jgi:hypothetical protein
LNSGVNEIKNSLSSSLQKNLLNAETFYFDEKNYSKAVSCLKISYEMIENLNTIKTKLHKLEKGSNLNSNTNLCNKNDLNEYKISKQNLFFLFKG